MNIQKIKGVSRKHSTCSHEATEGLQLFRLGLRRLSIRVTHLLNPPTSSPEPCKSFTPINLFIYFSKTTVETVSTTFAGYVFQIPNTCCLISPI